MAASAYFPHARQRVFHIHVAGAQQLVQELRVHLGADPHRSHAGADLLDTERFGHDLGQRVHVRLKLRIVGSARSGLLQFHSHITGEVRRGVDEFVSDRIGEHQSGQRGACLSLVHAEHVSDQRQVDATGAIQAHRDRISGSVDALGLGARGDDPARHDRRWGRGLVGVVELLQREHERPERVASQ
ncbi:hypothetical protein ACFPRL_06700 [Pseudoclavibacter helvolus]